MVPIGMDPGLFYFNEAAPRQILSDKLALLEKVRRMERSFSKSLFRPSKNTVLALIESGAFPYRGEFQRMVEANDPDCVHSSLDLSRLIGELLDRPYLDSELSVQDALIANVEVSPPVMHEILPASILNERDRILTLIGIYNLTVSERIPIFMIAARDISIDCLVEMLDPEIFPPITDSPLPRNIHLSISNLAYEKKLNTVWSAQEFWENAESDEDLLVALRLKCIELLDSHGHIDEPVFSIGKSFATSLKFSGAYRDAAFATATLTKCALVMTQPTSQTIKALLSADGDPIFRKSDSAQAMRAHITKDGVGLRLMYWQLPSLAIELANVGPKHELWIAE